MDKRGVGRERPGKSAALLPYLRLPWVRGRRPARDGDPHVLVVAGDRGPEIDVTAQQGLTVHTRRVLEAEPWIKVLPGRPITADLNQLIRDRRGLHVGG